MFESIPFIDPETEIWKFNVLRFSRNILTIGVDVIHVYENPVIFSPLDLKIVHFLATKSEIISEVNLTTHFITGI